MKFQARVSPPEAPDAGKSGICQLGLTPRPGPKSAAPSREQRGGAEGTPMVSAHGGPPNGFSRDPVTQPWAQPARRLVLQGWQAKNSVYLLK